MNKHNLALTKLNAGNMADGMVMKLHLYRCLDI